MMFVMINDTLQPTHTTLSNVDQPVYLVRIGNFLIFIDIKLEGVITFNKWNVFHEPKLINLKFSWHQSMYNFFLLSVSF